MTPVSTRIAPITRVRVVTVGSLSAGAGRSRTSAPIGVADGPSARGSVSSLDASNGGRQQRSVAGRRAGIESVPAARISSFARTAVRSAGGLLAFDVGEGLGEFGAFGRAGLPQVLAVLDDPGRSPDRDREVRHIAA